MPPKGKHQNNNSGKKNKRKQISPLCADNSENSRAQDREHITRTLDTNDQHVHTTAQHGTDEVSKRLKLKNPSPSSYTPTDSPYLVNMNYTPQAYPGSTPGQFTTPQRQYTLPYVPVVTPGVEPPPWAVSMMEDIQSIKCTVARIEHVEKTVNSISSKLNDLEIKVSAIDKRVIDVENASAYISNQYDQQSTETKSVKANVKGIQDSCATLQKQIRTLETQQESTTDRVLDGEYRNMRENLIFYGIPETHRPQHGDSVTTEPENSEALVKDFIKNYLKVDSDSMAFDRAHRMGNPEYSKKPRPIVVKFHSYSERETVRTTSYTVKDDLKKTNHGVGIQLPKEWREARRDLYPVMQTEKRKGHKVKLVADKLYINGQQYMRPVSSAH